MHVEMAPEPLLGVGPALPFYRLGAFDQRRIPRRSLDGADLHRPRFVRLALSAKRRGEQPQAVAFESLQSDDFAGLLFGRRRIRRQEPATIL